MSQLATYADGHALGARHAERGRPYSLPFGGTQAFVRGYSDGYMGVSERPGFWEAYDRGEIDPWGEESA